MKPARLAAAALPLLCGLTTWPAPPARAQTPAPSRSPAPRTAAVERLEDAVPAGPTLDERLAEIRRRVQQALRYPALARSLDLSGETRVRFRIGRDGLARDVTVSRTSGLPLLDAAAVRAVVEAGALPRLRGPLEIPVRFELERR